MSNYWSSPTDESTPPLTLDMVRKAMELFIEQQQKPNVEYISQKEYDKRKKNTAKGN